MISYVKDNILNWTSWNCMVSGANTLGAMGAGLAAQIKEEYPQAFEDITKAKERGENVLGNFTVTKLLNGNRIIHLYQQSTIGTDKRCVDYESIYIGLETLEKILREKAEQYTLAIPFKLGCGLAGGSWHVVKAMIETIFLDSPVKVVIVEYVKKKENKK